MRTWLRGAVICLVWLCAAGAMARETLRLATGELPPYATQSRSDSGIALNIVRAAFRIEGIDVAYTFLPWERALEEARSGRWDGTAYWGRKAERERDFWLSDNVLTEQWVLLHRASLALDWQRLDELGAHTIAAIRAYTYTPEFHQLAAQGRLKIDWTPDDLAALRKLAAGRVDIVPLDRNVACDLLARHFTAAEAARVKAHPRLITSDFTTHLMLPRSLATSPERLASFNRGLARLRASGEYQRLLEAVECKAGLAQPLMPR